MKIQRFARYAPEPEPAELSVAVLGPITITTGTSPSAKLPKKARALVAYLACRHGQALGRMHVADLLWPLQDTDASRHSLRNCLLELRRVPAIRAHLVADFESLQLRDVDLDLDWFERLAESHRREDLRSAAALCRGEFLADLVVQAEPFEDWLAAERNRIGDLVKLVLRRLALDEDAAGDFEAALMTARRLVALDPLCDEGQQILMRACVRSGNRAGAVRQYREFAHLLRRELGVAPAPETQELLRGISAGSDQAIAFPDRKSQHLMDEILANA